MQYRAHRLASGKVPIHHEVPLVDGLVVRWSEWIYPAEAIARIREKAANTELAAKYREEFKQRKREAYNKRYPSSTEKDVKHA